jgi:hypothetical protein
MTGESCIYRIDRSNTITEVSRNWVVIAEENDWSSERDPSDVVGRPIGDFIEDAQTRQLYEEAYERVRNGTPCGPIPFRCDSPGERRWLELYLEPLRDGTIEITSKVVRTERRAPVQLPAQLYDGAVGTSDELLKICSMCKKLAVSGNEWVEIEDGLAQLRVFERDEMPRLTHGVCDSCYRTVMDDLDDTNPSSDGTEDDNE